MRERTRRDSNSSPGDVTSLPKGHDAWGVGDEPAIVDDFFGASHYAKEGRGSPRSRRSAAGPSLAIVRTITLEGPRDLRLRTAVPESRRERMKGLVDRDGLDPDEALLLERTRSVHTFGMRLAITAALLDRQWVVRALVRMPPRRILLPRLFVRHVLELAEGADVRPGDRLESGPATRSLSARSSR